MGIIRNENSHDSKKADQTRDLFGKHISYGQVRYLRCARLDILESRRQGIWFINSETHEPFIDAFTSAGSFNVGRGNESVIEALDEALKSRDMGSSYLLSEDKIKFAAKLASLCPGNLNRVHPAGSGADSVECAIKLARGATGRNEIISMEKAYHGHSGFSLSANGKEHYKKWFKPLMPGFHFAPFGDFEALEALASDRTAAIILEPVQGEGGIHVASPEYLRKIRKLCDRHGILLILDEIQTGLGRTGRMWASEYSGVVPDIMVVAKSISGGIYPNAATVYRDDTRLCKFVDSYPDFHTSSGGFSDLGCRVSMQVLDYIVENRLWENAERIGSRFKAGLEEIASDNPGLIKDVRGLGLMMGIEYQYEFLGALMVECLARNGVWAAYSGNAPQVMRFQIPLTVSESELEELLERTRKAVSGMKLLTNLLVPLCKISPVRSMLDNMKVQIKAFNILRDIEDEVKSW